MGLIPAWTWIEVEVAPGVWTEGVVVNHSYDDDEHTRPLLNALVFAVDYDPWTDPHLGMRAMVNVNTREVRVEPCYRRRPERGFDLVATFLEVPLFGKSGLTPRSNKVRGRA